MSARPHCRPVSGGTAPHAIVLTVFVALLSSACGTVYVNPEDRQHNVARRTDFRSPVDPASTYRRMIAKLDECLAGYSYRVHGDNDRSSGVLTITVDTGIGFERSLFLADSIFLEVRIAPHPEGGSAVTLLQGTRHSDPFVRAAPLWISQAYRECRA